MILEPIFEADFLDVSFGFRPRWSATDAKEVLRRSFIDGYSFVFEADIRDFLVASSHCLGVRGGGVEEGVFGSWDEYSWAFSVSVADVDGLQLPALDQLQHCLAGDAEDSHRVDDRDVAGGGVFDELGAEARR